MSSPTLLNQLAGKLPRVPLRSILVLPFVIQIFIAVGLTAWLSFQNGKVAVNTLANQLMEELSDHITQELERYLRVLHQINQTNTSAVFVRR